MLAIKIIKGNNLVIILGINKLVSTRGVRILTSIFLKNSISSNKFKISPKQNANKITINNLFKKFFQKIIKKYRSHDIFVSPENL